MGVLRFLISLPAVSIVFAVGIGLYTQNGFHEETKKGKKQRQQAVLHLPRQMYSFRGRSIPGLRENAREAGPEAGRVAADALPFFFAGRRMTPVVLGIVVVLSVLGAYLFQRRTNRLLAAQERRLRIILDTAMDAIITIDAAGNVQSFNRAAERLFGYEAGEILGRNVKVLMPEPYRSEHDGYIQNYLQTGEARIIGIGREVEGIRKDGATFPLELGVNEVEMDGERFFVGCIHDISIRRKMEETTRRLAAIVAYSEDAIIGTTLDGIITNWNRGAEKIYGYTEAEAVGQSITLVVPSDRTNEVEKILETVKAGKSVENFETVRVKKNGEYIQVSLAASPIKNDRGEIEGVSVIARDITRSKQIEEELRAFNETLEQRVAERTRELARSNAELQQFAYVASHDLQEPLRAVSGCLQLLEQGYKSRLDEGAEQLIFHAVDGSNRMRALINGLLELSRVNTRGADFEPTDFEAVLNLAVQNLQVSIEESGAILTHDPLPTAMADRRQMTQVFQNLISNALKFQSGRTPEIHIGAERGEEGWMFRVEDNGIGIASKHRERIFEIFHRLHTRDTFPGAGIGLAVCKKIVERHGGRIWVESEEERGSAFYFTIPAQSGV